jgi:hypothetical protein
MRRFTSGLSLALIAWAIILAWPTYEFVFAAHPGEDRGGYTCSGSAISTALHPGFVYLGKTVDFNLPRACEQDAKRDMLYASLLDGVPLLVILSIAFVDRRAARPREREMVTDR